MSGSSSSQDYPWGHAYAEGDELHTGRALRPFLRELSKRTLIAYGYALYPDEAGYTANGTNNNLGVGIDLGFANPGAVGGTSLVNGLAPFNGRYIGSIAGLGNYLESDGGFPFSDGLGYEFAFLLPGGGTASDDVGLCFTAGQQGLGNQFYSGRAPKGRPRISWRTMQLIVRGLSAYFIDPALKDNRDPDFWRTYPTPGGYQDLYGSEAWRPPRSCADAGEPLASGSGLPDPNPYTREGYRQTLGGFSPGQIDARVHQEFDNPYGVPKPLASLLPYWPNGCGFKRVREREITSLSCAAQPGQRARFVVSPQPRYQDGSEYPGNGQTRVMYGMGELMPATPVEEYRHSTRVMEYGPPSGSGSAGSGAVHWHVADDQFSPVDRVTFYGTAKAGDILGPWILNDLYAAIEQLKVQLYQELGAVPEYGPINGYPVPRPVDWSAGCYDCPGGGCRGDANVEYHGVGPDKQPVTGGGCDPSPTAARAKHNYGAGVQQETSYKSAGSPAVYVRARMRATVTAHLFRNTYDTSSAEPQPTVEEVNVSWSGTGQQQFCNTCQPALAMIVGDVIAPGLPTVGDEQSVQINYGLNGRFPFRAAYTYIDWSEGIAESQGGYGPGEDRPCEPIDCVDVGSPADWCGAGPTTGSGTPTGSGYASGSGPNSGSGPTSGTGSGIGSGFSGSGSSGSGVVTGSGGNTGSGGAGGGGSGPVTGSGADGGGSGGSGGGAISGSGGSTTGSGATSGSGLPPCVMGCFQLGQFGSWIAPCTGTIYLKVNDSYYPDNVGSFSVTFDGTAYVVGGTNAAGVAVRVTAGQVYDYSASGYVGDGAGRISGPDGYPGPSPARYSCSPLKVNSLVGTFVPQDEHCFATCVQLGTALTWTAPCDGCLTLIVNDARANFGDDAGYWSIDWTDPTTGQTTRYTLTGANSNGLPVPVAGGVGYTVRAYGTVSDGGGKTFDADGKQADGTVEAGHAGSPCPGLAYCSLVGLFDPDGSCSPVCCPSPLGAYDDPGDSAGRPAGVQYNASTGYYEWAHYAGEVFDHHVTLDPDGRTLRGADSSLTAVWDGCSKLAFSNGFTWHDQRCAGTGPGGGSGGTSGSGSGGTAGGCSGQLTGDVIGTGGSYSDAGNTIANVFDGDLTTYFDAPVADGAWAGLDLGSSQAVAGVEYCPRSGFAGRMVGGKFQVSSTSDFSAGVTDLYTIAATPAEGTYTLVAFPAAGTGRYFRYLSPAGGWCNIAELVAYGSCADTPAVPNVTCATAKPIASLPHAESGSTDGRSTSQAWWRVTVAAAGSLTVSVVGGATDYDTVLTLYGGTDCSALAEVDANDDHDGTAQSQLDESSLAPGTYWICLDGFGGGTGSYTLTVSGTAVLA